MIRPLILLALLTLAPMAHAADTRLYIGAGMGHGSLIRTSSEALNTPTFHETVEDTSYTYGAFVGYRYNWVAVECGYMSLPTYHAHANVADYPLYKGLPSGTYPQTIDLQQTVKAQAKYVRINVYAPTVYGIEPYVFGGMARTTQTNHEYGIYNGTDYVTYADTTTTTRGLYGVGMQAQVTARIFVRGEYLNTTSFDDHTGRYGPWTVKVIQVSVGVDL